jgi:hypothetical protein
MPTPRLPLDQMQEALDLLAAHDWNATHAAKASGIDRSTLRHRADKARQEGLTPNTPRQKPRIRVPARSSYQAVPDDFSKAIRVMVFGCAHDAPGTSKQRFANAGKLAADLRPDVIVDLGDTMDLDSLSGHAIPGSADDRQRPSFRAEIASLTEAQEAFNAHAPSPDEVARWHLHGNHENRAWRYEQNNPTSDGVFTLEIDQVYARFGWTVKSFREWLYLNGVGFTHAPINGMGREVGGVNANQTVAREATHSVVWSHTHKREFIERPKFGVGNGVQVYNTGSFMPQGYLKAYAGLSMTGWTYGVSELTLRDGQIESARYWSELELREKYA